MGSVEKKMQAIYHLEWVFWGIQKRIHGMEDGSCYLEFRDKEKKELIL